MSFNRLENSYLRPVTGEDAKQLFEWTNEAETRKNSFSSEPVLWENHIQWLEKKLADENCLFFILMLKDSAVGTVRLDIEEESHTGTVSYSIDKQFRGMGFGGQILTLVEEKAKEAGLSYLVGEVKVENKASGKCFLKNKYYILKENDIEVSHDTKVSYQKKLEY